MNDEKRIDDDPVIRRVAAVRPPVPEEDLSPDGRRARVIAERVRTNAAATPVRGWRAAHRPRLAPRPGFTLPRLGLGLTGAVAAVVALLLTGTFSGPGNSGTHPAAAAVLRAAFHALDGRGAIFIENETYVSGPAVHGHPYTLDQVTETPAGPGAQNVLTRTDAPHTLAPNEHNPMSAWAYVGGEQAFYIPATNTIYEMSIWGPYLHPGSKPGTYVYRYAPGAFIDTPHPVTVTARQRRELLTGEAVIRPTDTLVGTKVKKVKIGPPKVQRPEQGADYTQYIRDAINDHVLHYAGRMMIAGRPALKLSGKTTDATAPEEDIYLDPETHLPFEEVDSVGTRRQTVIHITLRRLPITAANKRLLSLHALYPTARIDRNPQDYLAASHRTQIYPG